MNKNILDLGIIVIAELEVRVQVPSLRERRSKVSDRRRDNPVSVAPMEKNLVIATQVVANLRETRPAVIKWMPKEDRGGERGGERECVCV